MHRYEDLYSRTYLIVFLKQLFILAHWIHDVLNEFDENHGKTLEVSNKILLRFNIPIHQGISRSKETPKRRVRTMKYSSVSQSGAWLTEFWNQVSLHVIRPARPRNGRGFRVPYEAVALMMPQMDGNFWEKAESARLSRLVLLADFLCCGGR